MYSNLTISGDFTDVSTPTTLWSLIAKVATKDRAASLISHHALNSQKCFGQTAWQHSLMIIGNTWHRADTGTAGCGRRPPINISRDWRHTAYNTVAFLKSRSATFRRCRMYIRPASRPTMSPMATLWETYSSEYLRQGYMQDDREASHSNFAGWTPA